MKTATSKTDIPPQAILRTVGIEIKKNNEGGMKFVFNDTKVIDDLKQIGFSLDVLRFQEGDLSLPELEQHLEVQAALEAYWSAKAEKQRFIFSCVEDEYNIWYEKVYAQRFDYLQNKKGIGKPTQKEVDAAISKKYPSTMAKKLKKKREAEYNYRILNNAIYTSIVTKGKMLQSLRNTIQGQSGGFGQGLNSRDTIGVETKKPFTVKV